MQSFRVARLSMNELTTLRWSMDEDLYHYSQAGFSGVGVWREKLMDFGVERGIELIAESGLEVSNLTWAGGFTGNEGRSLEAAIADSTHAIELAEAINAGCLVLYTGGRNLHTRRHADRLLRAALEDLLPVAEARRVTLALKPMHPACAGDWTLLNSLDSACRLVDEYRSDALKLVYDTYHFPDTDAETLARIADKVAVVHLADIAAPHAKDQDRELMGAGRAPLARIVRTLVDNGFDGFFDVELIGSAHRMADYAAIVQRAATAGGALLAGAKGLAAAAVD